MAKSTGDTSSISYQYVGQSNTVEFESQIPPDAILSPYMVISCGLLRRLKTYALGLNTENTVLIYASFLSN